jgi:hypothetical protein
MYLIQGPAKLQITWFSLTKRGKVPGLVHPVWNKSLFTSFFQSPLRMTFIVRVFVIIDANDNDYDPCFSFFHCIALLRDALHVLKRSM